MNNNTQQLQHREIQEQTSELLHPAREDEKEMLAISMIMSGVCAQATHALRPLYDPV
jgi:hypothetical protein